MILQALNQLYYDLVERGEIALPGWVPTKISYALSINEQGELTDIIPMLVETQIGKKIVLRPQEKRLPAPVKKTSAKKSNFLWENAAYLLGFGKNDADKCFAESARLHHELLDGVDSPIAMAILRYFDSWDVAGAESNPIVAPYVNELMKGANLLFRVNGVFAQDDPQLRTVWQSYYDNATGTTARCMVTGQEDVIALTHPSIKGVAGAQSSGAALVSFNAKAFCSYGKEQNMNAPVGKNAAFAYTSALNYLLADRENVQRIGDTTIVCWAEGAEPQYTSFSCAALFGAAPPEGLSQDDVRSCLKNLAQGLPVAEFQLDPQRTFYVLGIAPNAARLSVRFFHRDSFGSIMKNVNSHHERLEIVGSRYPMMSMWRLLDATVNQNASDKSASPVLAGAVARAVFSGTLYPAALLSATNMRIRAEQEITPERAAIIKAYYLKNAHELCPKEVLTVSLNENSNNVPYVLGRMFYLYEYAQETANPGINATIKDKYFNSASATPAVIFPVLDNLYSKHLRKMDAGKKVFFERQVSDLKNRLGESYPTRMTLPEQGAFNLGYYHQKEYRFTKKEDK